MSAGTAGRMDEEPFRAEKTNSSLAWLAVVLTAVGFVLLASVATLQLLYVGPERIAWLVVRATGMASYVFLGGSVFWGMLTSSRLLMKWVSPPVTSAVHSTLSSISLVAIGLHSVVLLQDRWFSFGLIQVLVPFTSPYRPIPVGLGVIATYILLAVLVSSHLRKRLGQKAWRLFHFLSLPAFALATLHGALSGTDSGTVPMFSVYVVCGALILFLAYVRILAGRNVPVRRERVNPTGGVET